MRGNGWGRDHYIVNYVWDRSYNYLYRYHRMIMLEMLNRNYNLTDIWMQECYRGKKIGTVKYNELPNIELDCISWDYPEHNKEYLSICLHNLKYSENNKGMVKNIDLFKYFTKIKDLGYSLDDYEKKLRLT